jgi:hypothetical protein
METGTKLGIAVAVLAAAGVGGYFYWKSKHGENEGDEYGGDEDEGDSETSPSKMVVDTNTAVNTGKKLDVVAPTQILGAVEGYYDGWRGYANPSVKTSNKLYWDAWEKGQLDKAKGKPEPPKGSYGVTKSFDGLAENNPLKY